MLEKSKKGSKVGVLWLSSLNPSTKTIMLVVVIVVGKVVGLLSKSLYFLVRCFKVFGGNYRLKTVNLLSEILITNTLEDLAEILNEIELTFVW